MACDSNRIMRHPPEIFASGGGEMNYLLEILKKKNNSSTITSLFVVVIVMMLIIPLPTFLLDVFMACNFLLGILILLISLSIDRPTHFSSFPSLLLISTLLGLGLNVSSTRLILSMGAKFDGAMVNAFAKFVVGSGGNDGLLVGFVIFIILIAVQAGVITKGAGRTSEVKARFELDQMATKQMAVDNEYNSGAITYEQAQEKKKEIANEIDFYSTMDGASKFVSGNVKIGILITVINLLVGIVLGMILHHEPFSQAIQTYAKFTIGDGLLSQMPALFVSVASGLLISRGNSSEDLGEELSRNFSVDGKIYIVAGCVMALMGVLPNFPHLILIAIAGILIFYGAKLSRDKNVEQVAQEKKEAEKPAAPVETSSVAQPHALSLELGYSLALTMDDSGKSEKNTDGIISRIQKLRSQFQFEMGFKMPLVHLVDNTMLDPAEYVVKFSGVEVGRGLLRIGWYLCFDTGNVSEPIAGENTTDPAFGMPALWIPADDREKAEDAGYTVVDTVTALITHLQEIIKSHADELLNQQTVSEMLNDLKADYPAIVKDAETFRLGEIQKVLQSLLRENVPINNIVTILETMSDYSSLLKSQNPSPWMLVEKVRQNLRRQICAQNCQNGKSLYVFYIEQEFLKTLGEQSYISLEGPVSALEGALKSRFVAEVNKSLANAMQEGYQPVILCPENSRALVRHCLASSFPRLSVLSFDEIAPDIQVESLGEISVPNQK